MNKFTLKTAEDFKIMAEGGAILAKARRLAAEAVAPGITTIELDSIANKVITEAGGYPGFKKVPGYKHATCINVNDVVVHGIPGKQVIKNGDKVAIDVGVVWKGLNTDGAVSVICGASPSKFLQVAKKAMLNAIKKAKPGNYIWDLSQAMQTTVEASGYSAVRALTGHGIGKLLHEEPSIPCFTVGERHHSQLIVPGMALAIEIMANEGDFEVAYINNDGWTIGTVDGKISALFEETVAITNSGSYILTQEKI
jgi:methionyl aminopeptidase